MPKIYGKLCDSVGRCIHYHQVTDIVAMKCAQCNRFYACYRCHNEEEVHPFAPLIVDNLKQLATVLCGNCQTEQTYDDYIKRGNCGTCQRPFNPKCTSHHEYYFSSKK